MELLFRATIVNGQISGGHDASPLESVILQSTKRRHHNNHFMRFLLAELLECEFNPALLPEAEFAPLLKVLCDMRPVYASTVEINSVNQIGPCNPRIVATAEFVLPVKRMLPLKAWTYEMSSSRALLEAVRFYWAWPDAPRNSDGMFDASSAITEFHPIFSDFIAFDMVDQESQSAPDFA